MNNNWQKLVLRNFDAAAPRYNNNAELQKKIAWELANLCSKQSIAKGIWLDLGSGTGLLAESLEHLNPDQSVLRIDNSKAMLDLHTHTNQKRVWDLNNGLPHLSEAPKLIASSFVLHWLINPTERLTEWFNTLGNGGLLAVSIPIKGSFPEWYQAAQKADVPCTALSLPLQESLIQTFSPKNIQHNQLVYITQKASNVTSLFKSIVKVGAQTSQESSLKIGEWKRLQKAWAVSKNKEVSLTWVIQLLLVKK